MTTLISGIIMVLSGLVFIGSLIAASGPKNAKAGDTFAHVNPGLGDNPNEPPRPFVSLYTVEEVKDGKARKKVLSLHLDGTVKEYETWDSAYGLGQYDTKLER